MSLEERSWRCYTCEAEHETQAFGQSTRFHDILRHCIKPGATRKCLSCKSKERGEARKQHTISCNICKKEKPIHDFAEEDIIKLRTNRNLSDGSVCKDCSQHIKCRKCGIKKKRDDFDAESLQSNESKSWDAICKSCALLESVECVRCRVKKGLLEFSRETRSHSSRRWHCLSCQFPKCIVCKEVSRTKVNYQYTDDNYFCNACAYPPCVSCGAARPVFAYNHVRKKLTYMCNIYKVGEKKESQRKRKFSR